ncbi:MAG TPA: hypothetical protein VGM37_19485 [Armatimonadota bacterium]|jgi:hypothetical protein
MLPVPAIPLKALVYAVAVGLAGASLPAAAARVHTTKTRQPAPTHAAVVPAQLAATNAGRSPKGDGVIVLALDRKSASSPIMRNDTADLVVRQPAPSSAARPEVPDQNVTRLRLAESRSFTLSNASIGLDARYLDPHGNDALETHAIRPDEPRKYTGIKAGAVTICPFTKRPLRLRFRW